MTLSNVTSFVELTNEAKNNWCRLLREKGFLKILLNARKWNRLLLSFLFLLWREKDELL